MSVQNLPDHRVDMSDGLHVWLGSSQGEPAMSLYPDLKDKRVMITGAASGIGLATARRFIDEEASVFIVDWDEEVTYYIRCGDLNGKTPEGDDEERCSIIIEASDL